MPSAFDKTPRRERERAQEDKQFHPRQLMQQSKRYSRAGLRFHQLRRVLANSETSFGELV